MCKVNLKEARTTPAKLEQVFVNMGMRGKYL